MSLWFIIKRKLDTTESYYTVNYVDKDEAAYKIQIKYTVVQLKIPYFDGYSIIKGYV